MIFAIYDKIFLVEMQSYVVTTILSWHDETSLLRDSITLQYSKEIVKGYINKNNDIFFSIGCLKCTHFKPRLCGVKEDFTHESRVVEVRRIRVFTATNFVIFFHPNDKLVFVSGYHCDEIIVD